jgi:hypothetical protein
MPTSKRPGFLNHWGAALRLLNCVGRCNCPASTESYSVSRREARPENLTLPRAYFFFVQTRQLLRYDVLTYVLAGHFCKFILKCSCSHIESVHCWAAALVCFTRDARRNRILDKLLIPLQNLFSNQGVTDEQFGSDSPVTPMDACSIVVGFNSWCDDVDGHERVANLKESFVQFVNQFFPLFIAPVLGYRRCQRLHWKRQADIR